MTKRSKAGYFDARIRSLLGFKSFIMVSMECQHSAWNDFNADYITNYLGDI
ncbi:MAG: hypothetical protein KJO53_10580 [Eudoraea sp.]|nr:hypothetical protein [Eudoraea sp.]